MSFQSDFASAIDYIEENLTGEIDLNKVVQRAKCSSYHFQRMFSSLVNIPLSEYIRRRRITLAAMELQNTDAKIIDFETKQELLINQLGELILKGPQIFKGYWKKPEKTKEVLKDGWFYTKDIGRMDEDGIFYIEGRLDDMINVRGEKVWPEEVEKVLESHPKVREAAVIGVADDYYGQAIKACVVLKEGQEATKEELIEFCKDKLAPYKVPHIIEFFNELPKSNLGKTLHYKLKEQGNK